VSKAYYNEIDGKAAAWLRELIAAGLIADGEVDTRSIVDVQPGDLRGYRQCHFFAGIGGWSLALRLAGWPDDRAVWTGSCPCQPFSAAGKGKGEADERHLWPIFRGLIAECKPSVVFGEQVASALGRDWLAGVRADVEALGYALGAADLCAAGVGAFHIRQRLYFVLADYAGQGCSGRRGQWCGNGEAGELANAECSKLEARIPESVRSGAAGSKRTTPPSLFGELGDSDCIGRSAPWVSRASGEAISEHEGQALGTASGISSLGFWSDAEWIPCRDGKLRPVEPGSFPLAHGVPARVGRLRGYGNAIVPQVAAEFIAAYLDVTEGVLC
jgi:DNA (cytosine-5)-methyltransferase 1